MTRRHLPVVIMFVCPLVLATGNVVLGLAHAAAWLLPWLAFGGLAFLAYRTSRRVLPSRPPLVQGQVVSDDAGPNRLRAENDRLRIRLAEAEESAHAAWDAAASTPPRPAPASITAGDRLLTDRLGGVHDLFGSHQ